MRTKEEYEKVGRTKRGETVYKSRKDGYIGTEKDYTYLIPATQQEAREAGE